MSGWLSRTWYEVCRYHIMAGLTLGFSLRFEGGRNIPAEGPALLIANHESFLDPIAVGLTTTRQLCYLARKTLFASSLFGSFLRSVGCVPVDQEGVAKDGLKAVLDQLSQGRAVLVFPEGERTGTGQMNPLKPGIQLLIKRTKAPIGKSPMRFTNRFSRTWLNRELPCSLMMARIREVASPCR